jgi:hypothetical protein
MKLDRSPFQASPADIVAYAECHWTKLHGETRLNDGSIRPVPSSLEGMMSQLSGMFQLFGRSGNYDANPEVTST